ncbi:MAG: hypothetical protein RLZZ297_737, partial [Chloroflexota bacterium]
MTTPTIRIVYSDAQEHQRDAIAAVVD